MRRTIALLALLVLVACSAALAAGVIAPAARAAGGGGAVGQTTFTPPSPAPSTPAARALKRSLNTGMRQAGSYSGAEVVDLTTNRLLFAHNAEVWRLPASVEKLYTTSTALTRFGANATLRTSVLGSGQQTGSTYTGTLYLRGGGDPTFGSASFDQASYGTGATMQQLVANLVSATGIRRLDGGIVADESFLDSLRGTPATGMQPSIDVEGELSGLTYDRGWANSDGTVYWKHPALEAGQQFAAALKAAGVKLPGKVKIRAAATPASADELASISSPTVGTLIALTNAPSDNFFAEMLAKDLGARYGGGGTTAAGAAVIRRQVAATFGVHPRLDDGSGLSRYDRTTPAQVVTLLSRLANNATFTGSLAVAGRTGTLKDEMRGSYAAGRCRGKTGTLHDVSNLVGYCRAGDGHTLAFAFLMNGVYPYYAHPIQNRMAITVARYSG